MAERLSVSDVIENNLGNGLSVLEMAAGSFTGAVYSLSRLVVVDDCSLVVNEAKAIVHHKEGIMRQGRVEDVFAEGHALGLDAQL